MEQAINEMIDNVLEDFSDQETGQESTTIQNAATITKGLKGPDLEAWHPTFDI